MAFWLILGLALLIVALYIQYNPVWMEPQTRSQPTSAVANKSPDDIIRDNWDAVYQNRNNFRGGHGIWEVDTGINKVRITIHLATEVLSKYKWEATVSVYGSGKYPFTGHKYLNNHCELMHWFRKNYPLRFVHSPEYIDTVMRLVYESMQSPSKTATEFFGREVNY